VTILTEPLVAPSAAPLTNTQLALVTASRLAITTAFRIIYPLQPFLTQQLHVDLQTVGMLVTVQLLASLLSPLGGVLADMRGERMAMLAGLATFCAGALVCAVSGAFAGFLLGYALIGIGVALFQPSATGYLSARTDYRQRARALGLFETSWAGAALLGVAPLMQVVQATRTTAPVYWILLVVGVLSLVLLVIAVPAVPHALHAPGTRTIKRFEWSALRSPSVAGMLAMLALVMFGLDMFVVVQSVWIKQAFGADDGMLGQVFGIAGAAELCGSLSVAWLVDRIGKRRATALGFVAAALCLVAMPFTAGNWLLLLCVTFMYFVAEEFAIVAAIPLMSGVAPRARATVLALGVMINGLGRAIGASASPIVWEWGGIQANTLLAAGATLLAVLICVAFVREVERLEAL
jgi:predicted MFS family arabinose efflux permease